MPGTKYASTGRISPCRTMHPGFPARGIKPAPSRRRMKESGMRRPWTTSPTQIAECDDEPAQEQRFGGQLQHLLRHLGRKCVAAHVHDHCDGANSDCRE